MEEAGRVPSSVPTNPIRPLQVGPFVRWKLAKLHRPNGGDKVYPHGSRVHSEAHQNFTNPRTKQVPFPTVLQPYKISPFRHFIRHFSWPRVILHLNEKRDTLRSIPIRWDVEKKEMDGFTVERLSFCLHVIY